MIKANHCLYLILSIFLYACTNHMEQHTLSFEQTNDSVFSIKFQDHHIKIDAGESGRIASYQLDGNEILIPRSIHDEFYGSTLWPAPQSEWNWPPPAQLDGNPYVAKLSDDGIYMESSKDSLTGLQFSKFFSFNTADTSFVITYTVKNLNDTPRFAAPWEVTRVKGGLSLFPLGEEPMMEKSSLKSVSVMNEIVWFDYEKDSMDTSQKLFSSGAEGWLAHAVDGILFIKVVQDIHPLKTAPGQGEIEIYAHHQLPYIELENHGQYALLEPNEFLEWRVVWLVRKLPGNIKTEKGNQALVQHIKEISKNVRFKKPL